MRSALLAALWCVSLAPAQQPTAPPSAMGRPLSASAGQPLLSPRPALPVTGMPPAATGPGRENLIAFDPQRVALHWQNNRWELTAGNVLLKDLGRRQGDGREVQRVVQQLGLTQLGTVGTPQPVMEYWLAGGRAPRGPVTGLRFTPLDLANLRIDRVQEQWCVRDGARVLFSFGTHHDEAKQALAIIRKYQFTHVAHVGHSPPAMTVFVSDPDGTATSRVAPPPSLTSRTVQPGGGAPNPVAPEPLPNGRQFGAAELRPDLANLAEHVPFDWRQVAVRRDGQQWKLASGSYVLAVFASEREARQGLTAVQHYRFNQHCLSGRPNPAFSYFLSNGRAPQGVMFGVSSTTFRPDALTVRQDAGRWVIGDASQTLIDFGDGQEEARQTLRAIQRHRFDRLCRIGTAPGMTFFVRGH